MKTQLTQLHFSKTAKFRLKNEVPELKKKINSVLVGKGRGSFLGCSVRVFRINGKMTARFRKK